MLQMFVKVNYKTDFFYKRAGRALTHYPHIKQGDCKYYNRRWFITSIIYHISDNAISYTLEFLLYKLLDIRISIM